MKIFIIAGEDSGDKLGAAIIDGGSINKISQSRKAVSSYSQGGIAKGCGGIMKDRRKVTKVV